MKTPEIYLEEAKSVLARGHNYENWTEFAKSEYYRKTAIDYSAVAAKNALTAMKHDAEEELIEFTNYNERMRDLHSVSGLNWRMLTLEQRIDQFRNHKG